MVNSDNATDYSDIRSRVSKFHLDIFGGFHPTPDDGAPEGCETLLLLGPKEPGFWDFITASSEFRGSNPVDRWSEKIIGALAEDLGGVSVFPFGGPPYAPFISWAIRSGRAWVSPVSLLVHDTAGLFISYRGAIALNERIELPIPGPCPCEACLERPCLPACPVGALGGAGYDLAACHTFLDTSAGETCMAAGCNVRRACPVSQTYGRRAVQSAHHMKAFHP